MASAAPVVAVSAGVLWPLPSSSATGGLARSSMPTAEGMMSASTARRPPVMRCRKAARLPGRPALGQVRRDHRHHGDRDDAVGQLEEGVGVGVRRHRVGAGDAAGQHGDDEERELVGHHEAEGPPAQAGHGAQGVVARVPAPAQQPEVGPAQARDEGDTLEDDAERGAQPEQDQLGVVRSTLASEAPWPAQSPNQTRMPMQTRLLTIGAQATATKRRRVLSSAAASAKSP